MTAKNRHTKYKDLVNCREASEILGVSPQFFGRKIKENPKIISYFRLQNGQKSVLRFKYDDVIALKNSMKKGRAYWYHYQETDKIYINIEKTAKLLGIAKSTLYVWRSIKKLDIPSIRINGEIRYKLEDVKAYVKENTIVKE